MSGVLEAASQVTQGIDVFKDNIASKLTRRPSASLCSTESVRLGRSEIPAVRQRLPLCIKGDRLVRPYDAVTHPLLCY